MLECLTPVYNMYNTTDVDKWEYIPCQGNTKRVEVLVNKEADGYRLPTSAEWEYAAKDGKFIYAGSKKLNEVGWYTENSDDITHPVMQKKPNAKGLYDMSGNVREWCWDAGADDNRYSRGGGYNDGGGYVNYCEVDRRNCSNASDQNSYIGFRIVCSVSGS